MENEKRFLLTTDKDNWANHFGVIGGIFGLILLILINHMYSNQEPEEKLVFLGLCIVYCILLFSMIQDEICFSSQFSTSHEGIAYGGKLLKTRFIPWDSITSVSLSELEVARSAHPVLICCSINGSAPPRRKLHGMTYYRLNQKKYFVLKYSEERYKLFVSRTEK